MLKNYLKIAWRNLVNNKVSSIINIGGLAVGMSVTMLITLWIYDELNFNKSFTHYDRIARVMQKQTANGIVYSNQAMPYPIGEELLATYGSNFKHIVMASWERDGILSYGNNNISQHGIYMDSGAPEMLSLLMLKGDHSGLKEPNSILLAASAAKTIFGDEDPVNKLMKIDNKLNVKVTGVYQDIPANTDFGTVKYISTWELYTKSEGWIQQAKDEKQWENNSWPVFVEIAENTDFKTIDKKIIHSKQDHVNAEYKKYNAEVFLQPMSDWHLRSHWNDNGHQEGGAIQYVWLFGIVGAFVLLLACINFMNLSTARSEKRAKEVGIRKAVGSLRKHLVAQFYVESLVIVLLAFGAGLLLTELALPWFNQVAAKQMQMPWTNPWLWILSAGFIFLTILLSSSYPALYLSSFNPVKVLKGTFKAGRFATIPRKALVVVQFTISMVLIISTIVVFNQVQYSKNRPIGYNRNGLMMIAMKSPDFYTNFTAIEHELYQSGAVETVTKSSSPLTGVWSSNDGFKWSGMDPSLVAEFATIYISMDFGKAVGWQFKSGRDFSKVFATDSQAIVINEAAVKYMSLKDPVGTMVERNGQQFKIIGVINDMVMGSPYEPVQQAFYFVTDDNVNWIDLKLNPKQGLAASIRKIEEVFKKYTPSAPFEYKFADAEFATKFAAEERIATLATLFAALAIFISCLGLFGLASYVAEQRKKEIGIRKVLGASVYNLWNLISKEFLLLVAISFIVAIPLSYYFMHNWLQNYQYRTGINWWVFAVAGAGGFLITIITVSFQAIRAAVANPVKSLKAE